MIDLLLPLAQISIGPGSQPAPTGAPAATTPAPSGTTVGPATGPAVTTAPGATTQDAPPAHAKGPMDTVMQFLPFILIFGVLYMFLFRGQRKEEKNRKKMVELMKRGDEVMTIGGLVGKVVEVKEDRVVIKVDETTNVKETYLKSAIQRVLTPGDKDA